MKTTFASGTIGFIGAGNMAQSLIGGLLTKGLDPKKLFASDPVQSNLDTLRAQGVTVFNDNQALLDQCAVIVLAVKPQVMQKVVLPLQAGLQHNRPLLISIAAGINCTALNQWAGGDIAVVRCMPNTPSLLREGATGLFANKHVTEQQKNAAQELLEAVGIVEWVDEEHLLDAVTAVSGSGPAYFFLMLEAMVEKGVQMGLSENQAQSLAQKTCLGAAMMAIDSSESLTELRRRVTSPNGTTEAAINKFIEKDFSAVIDQSLQAAFDRSQALSKELS